MFGLILVYFVGAAFGVGFLIWLYTKNGKKWLKSL